MLHAAWGVQKLLPKHDLVLPAQLQLACRCKSLLRHAFVRGARTHTGPRAPPPPPQVLHDVKWYLAFLGLLVFGFATSFHILFRRDQKKHEVRAPPPGTCSGAVCWLCPTQPARVHTCPLCPVTPSCAWAPPWRDPCRPALPCPAQEFSNIGKSLVMMTTWLAGNADLNPLYEHAHNPGGRAAC